MWLLAQMIFQMSKKQGYVKSLGKLIRFVRLKLHTTLIQHFSCYHYCKGNLENFLFTHGQSSGTLMLKPAILEFHLFSCSVHPLQYPYMYKILSLPNDVSITFSHFFSPFVGSLQCLVDGADEYLQLLDVASETIRALFNMPQTLVFWEKFAKRNAFGSDQLWTFTSPVRCLSSCFWDAAQG